MPTKTAKTSKAKLHKATTAMHGVSEDGSVHFVGIGNLRVVIVPDGDFWFAQGLEIDYAAQGKSEEAAKHNFEYGLEATIEEHLKIHGTIGEFLKVAPPEIWKEFLGDPAGKKKLYSQFTSHVLQEKLPFEGIQYLVAAA